MNNLAPSVFRFESHEVRTVMLSGEPWFVAADVCAVLEIANPRHAISRLDDDEKGVVISDTLGGKQEMSTVNESGLYSLILTSRKPEAKRFKKWVTSEVLPSIRKTGSYQLHPEAPATLTTPAKEFRAVYGIARLIGMEKSKAALSANHATIKTTGVDMLEIMDAKKLIADKQVRYFTPTQLGERIGLSGQAFNKKLAELGLQEKHNNEWCPTDRGAQYSCLVDTGKRHNSGKTINQLHWYEDVMAVLDTAGGAE